jgi:hypothetical protein
MLYASLAASLFSAFLAMLGKQWLNRYASTDMRGTGIERSQDRQRKLHGIVTWYFDHVMESLPLMLQFALLLLGCALSLYLWGIDLTVAYVVLGVTALGVTLYAFFVIAGAASASCPYQTPGARILRHILPPTLTLLRSAFRVLVHTSMCLSLFAEHVWIGWRRPEGGIGTLLVYIIFFPLLLALDAYQVARAMARALVSLSRRVRSWIRSARSARSRGLDQRAAVLDSQCVSWIIQTSLEKGIRLSTLEFLATVPTLADFTPALVSECFDIFIECVKADISSPVIVRGMERLAEASAMCFFLTYSHLSIMDPVPSSLGDIRHRYGTIFPSFLNLRGFPFPHTLGMIHEVVRSVWRLETSVKWTDYKPTSREHVAVARALSKLSWSELRRSQFEMVPPLCLSFALHYLSQEPLFPPSIIADCLLIIAIYLGCHVPNTIFLEERYVHPWGISVTLLTNSQCTT